MLQLLGAVAEAFDIDRPSGLLVRFDEARCVIELRYRGEPLRQPTAHGRHSTGMPEEGAATTGLGSFLAEAALTCVVSQTGTGSAVFNNFGSFTKTGSAQVSFGFAFHNSGTVDGTDFGTFRTRFGISI